MKTIKFFVGALVSAVLFTSVSFANGTSKAGSKERASENSIRSQIVYTFSDVVVEENVDVYVLFSVDKENGFLVKEVSSLNQNFAETVKAKLNNSKISVPASLDGNYLIKIHFLSEGTSVAKVSDTDVLRSLIVENLNSLDIPETGSVNVKFSVKDNTVALKAVEGKNANLVKSVETALAKTSIEAPAGIAGNYQVKVTF